MSGGSSILTAYRRCMLCVGSDFNWIQAALRATAHDECLLATCMWNGHRVMIMTPWKEKILIFDEVERALFDMSLRPGVPVSVVVKCLSTAWSILCTVSVCVKCTA